MVGQTKGATNRDKLCALEWVAIEGIKFKHNNEVGEL